MKMSLYRENGVDELDRLRCGDDALHVASV